MITNIVQEFYDELVEAVLENKNVNEYIQKALEFDCWQRMVSVLKITRNYSDSMDWNRLLSKTRLLIVKTLGVNEYKANEIIGIS